MLKNLSYNIFGESHSDEIGIVVSSFPHGIMINTDLLTRDIARRMPSYLGTPRKEPDNVSIISGVLNGVTTGAPICCVIRNTNTRSADYDNIANIPRPSHADYAAYLKYDGYTDKRGGGHFSGRLTAPLVVLGALCKMYLDTKGIFVGAHIANIGNVFDTVPSYVEIDKDTLLMAAKSHMCLIDRSKAVEIETVVQNARANCDSVGGSIETFVLGLNKAIGSPSINSVESVISALMFSVPAVKAIEFGIGTKFKTAYGSEVNDGYEIKDGKVILTSNNNGGILGGIATTAPIVFTTTFKPTPSISKEQQSVNLDTLENTCISVTGRHDPCIALRCGPICESIAAIAITDMLI